MAAAKAEETAAGVQPAVKVGMGAVLVPVLLSTVVTLGAVAGGVMWLLKSGKLGASTAAPVQQMTVAEAPPPSHVVALEPMIVNLSDAGGHAYLRASMSLRIKDAAGAKKEEGEKAPKGGGADLELTAGLRDTALAVLSSRMSDQLLAADGREALKKALEHEFRERNPDVRVIEVYFTDFLVQR